MEKSYQTVVQYIKDEILRGRLRPGARLATERELAERLSVSRNSVREGLRILENMGVVLSRQGSGNYISLNFDETMSEVLSFMYFLKGIDEQQVTDFRRMIERDAMLVAAEHADAEHRQEMSKALKGLECAGSEEERVSFDREIHRILVDASGNDFLITNYQALIYLMDTYISSMRSRIIAGMKDRNMLEQAHRMIAEGVIDGDLKKGMKGLADHFGYIEQYRDFAI